VLDPGEQCDLTAGLQPCSPTCHREICGNGILDLDLDATPPINDNATSARPQQRHRRVLVTCQLARCGDGATETGVEQCDTAPGTATIGIAPRRAGPTCAAIT